MTRLLLAAWCCSLLSCGDRPVCTEERLAFVTQFDAQIVLSFENRTCYGAAWPDSAEMPEDASLWVLALDVDCQIHSVVRSIDVATLKKRQRWIEKLYSTRVKCDIEQVAPLVLRRCKHPRNVGLYGLVVDIIEVTDINPLLQEELRVGERCMFQLRRLIWDGDQKRYHPVYNDWLKAAIVGVDCPLS